MLFDEGPATALAAKLLRLLSTEELELLDAHTPGGANAKGWRERQAVTS